MWIVQFVGREVRLLNYYEAVGQEFAAHVNWLRDNDYGKAICILPHDGSTHDHGVAITPQGYLGKAGFTVEVVQNQGRGAAGKRSTRCGRCSRVAGSTRTRPRAGARLSAGITKKRDEHRNMGLGPEHDWSSHGATLRPWSAVYEATRPDETSWASPCGAISRVMRDATDDIHRTGRVSCNMAETRRPGGHDPRLHRAC